jgi:hypothetical protein
MLGDHSAIWSQETARVGSSLVVNTGIVTLLFTDIEGSTEKWEQEPEEWRTPWLAMMCCCVLPLKCITGA